MRSNRKNSGKERHLTSLLWLLFLGMPFKLPAQDEKTAVIRLIFSQTDSSKTCTALVTSDSLPVAGTEIHLYAKRYYSLLPVGKVTATDEKGEAAIEFPTDLPGDKNGMIDLIAKIEGDEKYGDAETQSSVKWGGIPHVESYNWGDRSLAASREKAPMFLVVVSNLIIVLIWGTLVYLVYLLYRIKKSGRRLKKPGITGE